MAWYTPPPAEEAPSWAYTNWDKHLSPQFLLAQQNIANRGLDQSSNPWAVLDVAYPTSSATKLRGSYGDDLLDAARTYLTGNRPAGPGPPTPIDPYEIPEPGTGQSGGSPATGI